MKNIARIIQTLETGDSNFPPTLLYNEGWMLRLILDWFSRHPGVDHRLNFHPQARWFSEALLPTAFAPRKRGDSLAESRTNADGVIGHFVIGAEGKADFSLLPSATQFLVLEAKMSSKLSSGTTNAPNFDQAARNVACMAEILCRARKRVEEVLSLGFYLIAPQDQINDQKFSEMEQVSIIEKVKDRVAAYGGEKDDWLQEWFIPAIDNIELAEISWEEIIGFIQDEDPESGDAYQEFYAGCIKYN